MTSSSGKGDFPTRTVVAVLAFGFVTSFALLSPPVRTWRSIGRWTGELADPEARTIAYQHLLEAGPAAVPALLELAGDRAARQRGDAIELLGRIEDPRALPVVLACDDPELAETRLAALGHLHGDEALKVTLGVLRGDDVALKFTALRALVDWPVPAADLLPVVEPYLKDAQPGLREFAARFMGTRKHAPAVPALLGLLRDPEPAVRQRAAWALMQIGDAGGIAAVDSAIRTGAVEPDED